MSDWTKQMADIQRQWAQQQQQLMTGWLESMKSAGGDESASGWRQAVDVMERQVDSALDGQRQSLAAFTENLGNLEGTPDAVRQGMKQMEAGIEQWSQVQRQMWKAWFDMLRVNMPETQSPAEAMRKNWEDMVRRTLAVQDQWLSNWTGTEASKDKAKKK